MADEVSRRGFLKASVAAGAAPALAMSLEEKALLAAAAGGTGAAPASASAGQLPLGTLGKLKVSRLIVGGNLISGFAHSRDLVYVSALLRRYFTDEKVFETLRLCEDQGINTAILRTDDRVIGLLDAYWNKHGGKIQWIAQCRATETGPQTEIRQAIDRGAIACYLHGGVGDRWAKENRIDLFVKALDVIRAAGLPAGVGGHSLNVPLALEASGVELDFYMKTLHKADYWSYTQEGAHDNAWCAEPEETVRFMKDVKRPWIAYKVLAAGAIPARDGLRFALEGGADFVCLGMFDFQVRDDVALVRGLLAGDLKRERPWRA